MTCYNDNLFISPFLSFSQIIRVTLDQPTQLEHRRFIWCKYVPEDNLEVATPKDCAYHFAVLQNDAVRNHSQ